MQIRGCADVLDLEQAAEGARRLLADAGLDARASFVPGVSSTSSGGGDIYLLKSVIHNWNDGQPHASCEAAGGGYDRQAASRDRAVIPRGQRAPRRQQLFDINMLVVLGSQERTEQEYRRCSAQPALNWPGSSQQSWT